MKAIQSLILCLIPLCGAALLEAQAPQWQWAVRAGGTNWDTGNCIAVDSQGNQYVTGLFYHSATFGSHTLISSGYEDIFIAKLDSSGNWLWAVRAGGTSDDLGYGIAVDGVGNAYVTGSFYGAATFGSHTLTACGGKDIFTAKLDTNGNWLWAVRAGGTSDDLGYGITVDGEGNALVTGSFMGTATFGSQTLTENGSGDIFVAKLDSSGNWLWAAQAGGGNNDYGLCIAVDGSGNAYVTGSFRITATFGNQTLTASGHRLFVAKLDTSGNWLWAVKTEGAGGESVSGIAVDEEVNDCITGSLIYTVYFGSHILDVTMYNESDSDIFVAKLGPSGNWLWAVQAGGIDVDMGYDIGLDGSGNACVTGCFWDTATFGSHTLTTSGFADIFVAKLDPSGNWLWVTKAGGTYNDLGFGIAVDGLGNAYVTGYFGDTATFGSQSLTTSGSDDIFVAKLENLTPVEDVLAPQAVARLHNAYPNPLGRGESALIKADIPERSSGTLSVFNLRGQMVARHKLNPGSRQVTFSGKGLPAGVYLYSLICGDYRETRKLVLLK